MRLLLITREYPPFIAGGATVAHNITHGQRALGHHVAVFTSCWAGEQPGPAQLDDVPLYRSAYLGAFADFRGLNLAAVFDEAMRYALHHEADLVHANDLASCLVATLLKLALDLPVAFTFHSTPTLQTARVQVESLKPPLSRSVAELIFRHLPYDVLVAGSRYFAEGAIAQGVAPERIRQVYIGTDTERFRPGLPTGGVRQRLGLTESDRLVLVPARLAPRKGIEFAIQALPGILASAPAARLVLTGPLHDNPYCTDLFAQARQLKVADAILTADGLPAELMPQLYNAAEVCVLPSRVEGLGMAVLEALACARPVVATATRGIDEIITDSASGLLVPYADPMAIAAAVTRLLHDPPLADQLGARGRELVEANFSLHTGARTLAAVYQACLRAPAVAPAS